MDESNLSIGRVRNYSIVGKISQGELFVTLQSIFLLQIVKEKKLMSEKYITRLVTRILAK